MLLVSNCFLYYYYYYQTAKQNGRAFGWCHISSAKPCRRPANPWYAARPARRSKQHNATTVTFQWNSNWDTRWARGFQHTWLSRDEHSSYGCCTHGCTHGKTSFCLSSFDVIGVSRKNYFIINPKIKWYRYQKQSLFIEE